MPVQKSTRKPGSKMIYSGKHRNRTVKCLLAGLSFFYAVFAEAEVIYESSLDRAELTGNWKKSGKGGRVVPRNGIAALQVTIPEGTKASGFHGFQHELPVKRCAGKLLRITVEAERSLGKPFTRYQGGKIMLEYSLSDGKTNWPGVIMKPGKFNWETFQLTAPIPLAVTRLRFYLGIQDAEGIIRFRNLKVVAEESPLEIWQQANRGFRDQKAGDGKGGWSDQGPDNDGAKFNFKKNMFANVPFIIMDPAKNQGLSILVFRSPKDPAGLVRADFDLSRGQISGRWLYLLHTTTWGGISNLPIGRIVLQGKNGIRKTLELQGGRDAADWWNPKRCTNAFPAAFWQNVSGGTVGVYVSRFRLPDNLGEIQKISFESTGAIPVWIVIAATVSEKEYKLPEQERYKITEGERWKRIPAPNVQTGILPGSALDLSRLNPPGEAGQFGRVVAGDDGFAFENGRKVRFFSECKFFFLKDFRTRDGIRRYAEQVRLHGYNMVRFHFLDSVLMAGATQDCKLNPKRLDEFDYLVYCLKKNGIYINIDAMASRIGYSAGYPWNPPDKRDPREFKFDIHSNPAVRNNWKNGITELLIHKNPYTGKRLVDDPVLAAIVCFNEQEFGFGRRKDFSAALPAWRKFLSKKYGLAGRLKEAWKISDTDFSSFDAVKTFSVEEARSENSVKSKDIQEFFSARELELYRWYKAVLREIGYRGLVFNYNVGKSFRHILLRQEMDGVAMNDYHAHPNGKNIIQSSSIGSAGNTIRAFLSCRISGKPFLVTEHAHVFWNKYRYEQSFITGAYAGFQNIGGLTAFANSINARDKRMSQFCIFNDPIQKASEFLTAFLFLRGDVKARSHRIRLELDPLEVALAGELGNTVSGVQSRLALVTGFGVGSTATLSHEELGIGRSGGAKVSIRQMEMRVEDSGRTIFDFDQFLNILKKKGYLPSQNASSLVSEIFENSTSELLMDCRRKFMRIETPRFQGICGEKGIQIDLKNLSIQEMSRNGNLSLVSLNAEEELFESKHMVLVFATNALNSEMVFTDASLHEVIDFGKLPVLLETGRFRVKIRNRYAAKARVYALGLDGRRRYIIPTCSKGDVMELNVDTAAMPEGPSIYFEIVTE